MKTVSVMLQNLCVPCENRCRYCLLSWDGNCVGVPWEAGEDFALRFTRWMSENRPDLSFSYSFGYSMEHPQLERALRFLRQIGSPQAEFLQCDGMKMRSESECERLSEMLAREGVKKLSFTVYGLKEYHDRFAARRGDFDLIVRMMRAARAADLVVTAGIPLTNENAPQADELIGFLRSEASESGLRLFIPHEEGRGAALSDVRLTLENFEKLSGQARTLLNPNVYRTEESWLMAGFSEEQNRTLIISLRRDNIDRYREMGFEAILAEAEKLDEAYYAAFPSANELAWRCGDPAGESFYSERDLKYHYRRLYALEHGVHPYDVCDERQTGSRRH